MQRRRFGQRCADRRQRRTTMPSETKRYNRAKKRVNEEKAFYGHALAYLLVNFGLFILDVMTPGELWFYWPLIGWGIGLGVHGAGVFLFPNFPGKSWEERKIREYMEKDQDK